jgi:hypothetical protein
MVSTIFVAASIATYSSFTSFETELQTKAAFAALSGLASQAAVNGSSEGTVTLPSSTISCANGSLRLTVGSSVREQAISLGCHFVFTVKEGPHFMRFSRLSAQLTLSVA